ncbi:TPA: hypothetical protein ACGVAY_004275, partial [Vibrio vulnificus]
ASEQPAPAVSEPAAQPGTAGLTPTQPTETAPVSNIESGTTTSATTPTPVATAKSESVKGEVETATVSNTSEQPAPAVGEPAAQPGTAGLTPTQPTGNANVVGNNTTQIQELDVQTFKQQSEQVQNLQSQVSQLQSEKFANDFDVFRGLNDTPPQPPQDDVHNDKSSTLTVNPNSLKL